MNHCVTMTQGKKIFQLVTSKDVCLIYELLHNRNFVSFPLTEESKNKVDALVISINSNYFDREIYSSTEEKAVAYLYFLIKDHPFTDGNKRTASLVFEVICDLNRLKPNYSEFTLDVVAVFIEKIQESDHQAVIRMLVNLLFVKK